MSSLRTRTLLSPSLSPETSSSSETPSPPETHLPETPTRDPPNIFQYFYIFIFFERKRITPETTQRNTSRTRSVQNYSPPPLQEEVGQTRRSGPRPAKQRINGHRRRPTSTSTDRQAKCAERRNIGGESRAFADINTSTNFTPSLLNLPPVSTPMTTRRQRSPSNNSEYFCFFEVSSHLKRCSVRGRAWLPCRCQGGAQCGVDGQLGSLQDGQTHSKDFNFPLVPRLHGSIHIPEFHMSANGGSSFAAYSRQCPLRRQRSNLQTT